MHSRSPQHPSGRMSPSPISSPRTTSGSSTPLTACGGAIPYNHLKQAIFLQDGFGSMPKSLNSSPYSSGISFHDSNPDIFRGLQPGAHIFSEMIPENDILGKQVGRPAYGELYDGQQVLADRVSRKLLRDHVKTNPSLDLSPSTTLSGRMNGI